MPQRLTGVGLDLEVRSTGSLNRVLISPESSHFNSPKGEDSVRHIISSLNALSHFFLVASKNLPLSLGLESSTGLRWAVPELAPSPFGSYSFFYF